MRRRRRLVHHGPVSKTVGAGYLSALFSGDLELIDSYLTAFSPDELLESMAAPLGLLVRYLGYHTGKTPTEIGDALVRAVNQTTKET